MYAYATIEPLPDNKIILNAVDKEEMLEFKSIETLPLNGNLDLIKGIYNRITKEFTKKPLSFKLSTFVDAPPGSGLGSSSTLAVAVLGAFSEWLKLPLGEYDLARLAYEIDHDKKKLNKLSAMSKMYASDVGMQVTTDAVQVMGGDGYTWEFQVEKMMRDAKLCQIYEGTNEVQRLVISKGILKE